MEAIKGIIIYTRPWNMEDEKTGEVRDGISVEYLLAENLNPVVNDDGSKGVRHCKDSISLDKADSIKQVPGLYNLNFGFKPGARGKVTIKLDDIKYLGPVPVVGK